MPLGKALGNLIMKKQGSNESFHIAAERAIDELRRQNGIVIDSTAFFPIEFLDEKILAAFRARGSISAVITPARAGSLGSKATVFDASKLSLPELMALADPTCHPEAQPKDLCKDSSPSAQNDSYILALILAKYASLLPAMLAIQGGMPGWLAVEADAIRHYINSPAVEVVETAQAMLPINGAENARIVSFRAKHSGSVHLALIVGEPKENPLTRVHSSCVTGDILGSLRCDCGDQLQLALSEITKAGAGVLIYLHQEGRGIGITNKLRAYALQERGLDTYEANRMLGFEEDERDFAVAAAILKTLGFKKIRLLTNNPHKIEALGKCGILCERVPLVAPSGRHNHAYLGAKARKHLL